MPDRSPKWRKESDVEMISKKVLASIFIIGLLALALGYGTYSYFSDTETSIGNIFTAGTIDININPTGGQDVVTIDGDVFLKPCQTGYTTTKITNVGTNPCEVWKHITNVDNREHGITEPEQEYYDANPGSENWLISDWIHYDMLVYKSLGYETTMTTVACSYGDYYPAIVTVKQDGCKITWTFDMVAGKTLQGDGHWGYGVVISLDGVHPEFQVHNNDGTDANYDWGTHLYSEWDNGWHTGDTNTPVSDLDWISCTGERYYVDNPDGIFTITIDKCKLIGDIYWAAHVGVGGFYAPNNGYSKWPAAWVEWSGDSSTLEKASITTLIKEIPETDGWFLTGTYGVASYWIYLGTLESGECMCVVQSYHLDIIVDNWGQSDRVFFDTEFLAQQIEGTPLPPEPTPVLSGHGRP